MGGLRGVSQAGGRAVRPRATESDGHGGVREHLVDHGDDGILLDTLGDDDRGTGRA